MTILSLIFFVLLIAFAGLIVDIGRLYALNTQIQSYVDEVALAAAAELDRESGSIDRAIRAAVGDGNAGPLVTDTQNFAEGDAALAVQRVVFLEALGADPAPGAFAPVAGDIVLCTYEGGALACEGGLTKGDADRRAVFVEITAVPRTENYFLLPLADVIGRLFGAGPVVSQATTTAQATAGFVREICNNVPLMICNPSEAVGGSGANFNPVPGRQIRAKLQGGGAAWGPGVFGVLDAITGNGASAVRDSLAKLDPNTSCVGADADVKPGQNTGPVLQGINVRHDLFEATFKSLRTDPQYAPAPNITKGLVNTQGGAGKSCDGKDKSTTSMPLPRDTCFVDGTGCSFYGGEPRFGNGEWDRAAYWALNHPGETQPAGYNSMSRYEVYRYEIENNPPGLVDTTDEVGSPTCSTATPSTDPDLDRRVLTVAVVNCIEHSAILNGNAEDVPVRAFAKVFLTEPAGLTAWGADVQDIFIEEIGAADPGDLDGPLKEYPVLYR